MDTWMFQQRGEREIARRAQVPSPPGGAAAKPSGLIGSIAIARLGFYAVITEGAGEATLRRAVGHVPGTALPGEPGNVGLAGHRDTFFQPLRNIRRNDMIELATGRGELYYQVVSTKVVGPDAVEVLEPTVGEALTLITCYPFSYIGAAPKRFIVRAERTNVH
jgi:sortase A